MMKISVLVVSFNAESSIEMTINSILAQEDVDFEIVIKDGGSTDGTLQLIPQSDKICVVVSEDNGIYDAMNQAVQYATGEYCIFLNCGDTFPSNTVLAEVCAAIREADVDKKDETIFYGDCYVVNRNYTLRYPTVFDDYVCLTKVLCHQATVYPTFLLKKRHFDVSYLIAADYEYYVFAYKNHCKLVYIPVVIANYEGDGASEKTINRRLALTERKRAMKTHFTLAEYRRVWMRAQFRGIGIKHLLVSSEYIYPLYKKLARIYYNMNY